MRPHRILSALFSPGSVAGNPSRSATSARCCSRVWCSVSSVFTISAVVGRPHVELLRRDADRLDLARQFDAVLFAYSLRMIPDWRAALAQAVAHLRPGGRVVVLDFGAFEGWPAVLRRAAGAYLRWNHVRTDYPLAQGMNDVLDRVEVCSHAGGYRLVARGYKLDAVAASAER